MKSSSRSSKRKSKRSQKHSKKKTRSSREKPKKLKLRDHSVSGSDDEDIISKSVSSSSPVEEDTRSKKRGRSRDGKRRKDKKRRKKSLLSDSSGGESPVVKKSKKSKKNKGSDSKKKWSVKRRRRDRSVSSSVSRSLNGDGEGEFEGKEEKVEKKERKGREKGKERKRRRRDRSVSSSSSRSRGRSCERNDDFEKEEKVEVKERKGREKGKRRKGRRRDRSISSSSSRSRSRYVCEANDECGRECEEKGEKMGLKERKGKEKDKERNANKRSGDRSRSYSPCSLHSESISYHSEERELENNNPKRLKSIIVVMKESEVGAEEQTSNRDDGHKDEIVCEFDDYPSKSNDSNDGVYGRESGPYSYHVGSEKRSLEESNRESPAPDIRDSEISEVQKEVAEGSVGKTPSYIRSESNDLLSGNRSEACMSEVGLIHEDLETILRQRALENLLKRQGKFSTQTPTDTKANHDIEMKKSSIVKAQPVHQRVSHDEENINNVHKEEKHTDHVKFISNSRSLSKDSDDRLLSMEVETAHPDEKGKTPDVFVNSRPSISTSRKEPLGAKNTWKRLSPQEKSQKKLSPLREVLPNNSEQPLNSQEISLPNPVAPQEISMDSTSPKVGPKGSTDADNVAASVPSASGDQHTNEKTNEADEEGQFQQKTMSVMRGGEMVQVSYKVYIPKKVPALARRQLKR